MLRTAIMIGLMAIALPASAKLYKCQDADGNVSYTDTPCTNGEELKLPPIPTYTPRNLPRTKAKEPQTEDKAAYTQLEVSKPKQDELIIENTGKLVIAINVTPGLKANEGHQFAIVLDGTRLKTSGTTTRVRVDNVDPGSHTVQALIIAKDGNTVKQSPVVSFYMKRQSVLQPQLAPGPQRPTGAQGAQPALPYTPPPPVPPTP